MKPYVEFEYSPSFGITIAGCEGDPIDPATVQYYAKLGNESAQTALKETNLFPRFMDAADEYHRARRAYRITHSPIAWGRLLRATVDYRLARQALHGPPLKRPD